MLRDLGLVIKLGSSGLFSQTVVSEIQEVIFQETNPVQALTKPLLASHLSISHWYANHMANHRVTMDEKQEYK